MFTVRHTKELPEGGTVDTLYECDFVQFRQVEVEAGEFRGALELYRAGELFARLSGGRAYVMNEHGKTVGSYSLPKASLGPAALGRLADWPRHPDLDAPDPLRGSDEPIEIDYGTPSRPGTLAETGLSLNPEPAAGGAIRREWDDEERSADAGPEEAPSLYGVPWFRVHGGEVQAAMCSQVGGLPDGMTLGGKTDLRDGVYRVSPSRSYERDDEASKEFGAA